MISRRALFLDRDGVLNHLVFYPASGEWESPRCRGDLRVIDGAVEGLSRAVEAGWHLFIVSNQPSCAKGKTSLDDLKSVHDEVIHRLGNEVSFTAAYYCFHHPRGVVKELTRRCDCRKPGTRFLFEAERDYDIDLSASWMIGDADTDVQCGRSAGCFTSLLQYPHSADRRQGMRADLICNDLREFTSTMR